MLSPVTTDFPLWDFHEPVYSIPGSPEPKPEEEQRRRRMISNRESARRLRARRKKHLADLGCQLDLLRAENRESKYLLRLAADKHRLIGRENERLMSEAAVLRRRLADMTWILRFQQLAPQFNTLLRAWPCSGEDGNDFACFNDELLAVNSLTA